MAELLRDLVTDRVQIVDVREPVEWAEDRIPGSILMPMGDVASCAHELDAVAIGDGMQALGWFVYMERVPPTIHLMLSPGHDAFIDRYLSDLREVVERVKRGEVVRERDEIKYGQ